MKYFANRIIVLSVKSLDNKKSFITQLNWPHHIGAPKKIYSASSKSSKSVLTSSVK